LQEILDHFAKIDCGDCHKSSVFLVRLPPPARNATRLRGWIVPVPSAGSLEFAPWESCIC
jgi:hypothetical protein